MMLALKIIIILAVGYAFGLFQTGYFLSKAQGVDIKHQGSGNSGATNMLRVMGKKAGLLVFLGDALKSIVPCTIVRLIFGEIGMGLEPDMVYGYIALMGLGVVLGHNYPFYLHFQGGKGISSTAGIAIAIDWRITVAGLLIFALVVWITKYVSIGSICGVSTLGIMMIIFAAVGDYGLCTTGKILIYTVSAVLILSALWSHRANWKRLANGTENKLGSKKKRQE